MLVSSKTWERRNYLRFGPVDSHHLLSVHVCLCVVHSGTILSECTFFSLGNPAQEYQFNHKVSQTAFHTAAFCPLTLYLLFPHSLDLFLFIISMIMSIKKRVQEIQGFSDWTVSVEFFV